MNGMDDDFHRSFNCSRSLLGTNTSVVVILLEALFQPVWQTEISGVAAFSQALVSFGLLVSWRQPAWSVVLFRARVGGLPLA